MSELRSYVFENERFSIRRQCELLGINRSGLYDKPVGESPENLKIMRLLDEHFLDHPTYGVLQMQDFLKAKSLTVNVKRVRRLMRLMNLMPIYPKKNLSKLGEMKYIRPYLLRNLKVERNNQVWAIDITYIPMAQGFMYLTAIIDLHSRFVVAWNVFNNLEAKNCLSVLLEAIRKYGKPEIVNSDQGSQFTSALWTEWLDNEGIRISMDGKGRALDNIFIERLWRTVKQDYVYLNPAENGTELFQGLSRFFGHYNFEKTHQGIGRRIPARVYLSV